LIARTIPARIDIAESIEQIHAGVSAAERSFKFWAAPCFKNLSSAITHGAVDVREYSCCLIRQVKVKQDLAELP
jgi:hypothetical protein